MTTSAENLAGKIEAISTVLIRLIEKLPSSEAKRLADELRLDISSVNTGIAVSNSDAERDSQVRELGIYARTASDVAAGK